MMSRVKTLLILTLFQVPMCSAMQRKPRNVLFGTEGGRVEIRCSYPNTYQYVYKYFCRDPCGHSDVLIETQKVGEVVSKGRYSIVNTVSARSISVTISNLRLEDSGVYYCGVGKWGKDIYTEIEVTVRKATPKPTAAPLSTPLTPKPTDLSSAFTVVQIGTGKSTTHEQASLTTQSTHSSSLLKLPVYGGVLGLLLCCALVTLGVLYKRRSSANTSALKPPDQENQISDLPPDQEDVQHVNEETLVVYSLAGPAVRKDPSETYTVIELSPSVEDDSCLYSLIAPH